MVPIYMCSNIIPLVLFASLLVAQQQDESDRVTPKPIIIGHEVELESKILGETREIMISVPRDYEKNESSCGVVYLLDGGSLFATAVAAVRHNAQTQLPLIVVGIKNTSRFRDLTPKQVSSKTDDSSVTGGGGAAKFRQFLVGELQPFINQNYRTNDLKLLVGHSLGGLFAFDTLVNQPEAFTGYFCMSPSLWWDNQSLLEKFKEIPNTHPLYSRFVYVSIGDESGAANVPVTEMEWHFKEHAPLSFRWHVSHFPGKDHWPVASPSLFEGLLAFFSPFSELREDETIGSFKQLKERHEDLSAKFGIEIPLSVDDVGSLVGRLARKGSASAGLQVVNDAEDMFPDTFDLTYLRAHLLVELKRFEDAIQVLETFLKRNQDLEPTKMAFLLRVLSAAKKGRDQAKAARE